MISWHGPGQRGQGGYSCFFPGISRYSSLSEILSHLFLQRGQCLEVPSVGDAELVLHFHDSLLGSSSISIIMPRPLLGGAPTSHTVNPTWAQGLRLAGRVRVHGCARQSWKHHAITTGPAPLSFPWYGRGCHSCCSPRWISNKQLAHVVMGLASPKSILQASGLQIQVTSTLQS